MIPLAWYLTFAAALFCLGLYAVLARKNAVAILMGIELMLNAVIVNLIAFWRYNEPENVSGQAFAIIVFAVAPDPKTKMFFLFKFIFSLSIIIRKPK